MTLEISYHKKCDYDYIILNDVKAIYPLDDRYKENQKEYIVLTKKAYKGMTDTAEALEKLLRRRSLFEREIEGFRYWLLLVNFGKRT